MTNEQIELLAVAKEAALKAYAPYSKFRVGAAVLTEGGIFQGANIENACYNLGICAERVAMSHARMNGCTNIIGIAVNCIDAKISDNPEESLTTPCGACRQWIAEFAPDAWVVTNGNDTVYNLKTLLPNSFVLK